MLIQLDVELFSLSEEVVDSLNVLSDVLVVVVVRPVFYKSSDLELLFEFLVSDFSFMARLDINVDSLTVVESFVKSLIVIGFHSLE